MTGVTIVNFSHPLTDAQRAGVAHELGDEIARVIDVPTHFDPQLPFPPQALDLIAATGLTASDWQTLPILVNPPSLAAIAAVVLAQLHGLMGHFPAIVRLRPVPDAVPPAFAFAEIIDLNALRIRPAQGIDRPREDVTQ